MKNKREELEMEYKAILTKEQFEHLKEYFSQFAETKTPYAQINYYFDIDDFRFIKSGITIRIREKEESYTLQIKIPDNADGEYNKQQEINIDLSEKEAKEDIENGLDGYDPALVELFNRIDASPIRLKMIGSLKTVRQDYSFYTDTISLDKSTYLGMTDYELEWETTNHQFVPFELKRLNLKPIKGVGKITRFLGRLTELYK